MLQLSTINAPEVLHFALKIGVATIAGVSIGLEREFKGKNAGLKTNTLVAIGATVFILISLKFEGEAHVDITRVLSQVVTGIGFLGAGVILQKGDKIKGLTTAATIWCSAAAGCLAAVSMFIELLILTVLVIAINIFFGKIDDKIGSEESVDKNS